MKNTNNKTIYFDLDGTVYPLYQQENWLSRITETFDPTIYMIEDTLVDAVDLLEVLLDLVECGYSIGVVSWLAGDSPAEYCKAVRAAKREWVKKFLPMATEIHIVRYGTPKHWVVSGAGILVDDVAEMRDAWNKGATINATKDIIKILRNLEG